MSKNKNVFIELSGDECAQVIKDLLQTLMYQNNRNAALEMKLDAAQTQLERMRDLMEKLSSGQSVEPKIYITDDEGVVVGLNGKAQK